MAMSQPPEDPGEAAQTPKSKAAADAKLLSTLHHELEASRGRLTVEKRKALAAKLLEHSSGDDTFFTRLSKKMQHVRPAGHLGL
jgi:hypothetical protein